MLSTILKGFNFKIYAIFIGILVSMMLVQYTIMNNEISEKDLHISKLKVLMANKNLKLVSAINERNIFEAKVEKLSLRITSNIEHDMFKSTSLLNQIKTKNVNILIEAFKGLDVIKNNPTTENVRMSSMSNIDILHEVYKSIEELK